MRELIGYTVESREVELEKHFFATFNTFMHSATELITEHPLTDDQKIRLFGIYAVNWKDTTVNNENLIV